MNTTMPKIKLSNGLCVANFSSPHPFQFTTGEVLNACVPERSLMGALEAVEVETNNGKWTDIVLSFKLTPAVREALDVAHADSEVDVILVPLPVMQAVKALDGHTLRWPKIRCIRCADRITKAIFPDRFCL